MEVEIIGGISPLKKEFLIETVCFFSKELISYKRNFFKKKSYLTIAFLSQTRMKHLNKVFRKKNKVTDVLSFAPVEKDCVGELALCMDKIRDQAKEHDLTLKEEVAYLILHGLLHLMGYQHENSLKEAQKMYKIQDNLFERWRKQ